MGRPAEHGHKNNASASRAQSRTHRRRSSNGSVTPWSLLSKRRQTSIGIAAPSVSSADTPVDHNNATQFTATAASELDGWPWPSPAWETSFLDTTNLNMQLNDNFSVSSPASVAASTRLTPYAAGTPPTAALAAPNSLFSNIEFFPTTQTGALELRQSPSSTEDTDSPSDDPVEELSKLHLELYQCLSSVKSVERIKKQRMHGMTRDPTEVVDTSWSERLFSTTERFIVAMKNYVGASTPTSSSTSGSSDSMSETWSFREGLEPISPVQVDSATGLMIVSCYTRLLQIFEVVVFVVETFRDLDCPGNYVQVRFGSFVPKTDKTMHARFLGQYVLHLLDGISDVVDRAVASRQLYARAIADIRKGEAKLKERISSTLQ